MGKLCARSTPWVLGQCWLASVKMPVQNHREGGQRPLIKCVVTSVLPSVWAGVLTIQTGKAEALMPKACGIGLGLQFW